MYRIPIAPDGVSWRQSRAVDPVLRVKRRASAPAGAPA
jgi:hypothetical protein